MYRSILSYFLYSSNQVDLPQWICSRDYYFSKECEKSLTKINFKTFFENLFYVYECLPECLHIHAVPEEARRGCRCPGTRIVGGWRCHVGAWNGTQVFWENNKCS